MCEEVTVSMMHQITDWPASWHRLNLAITVDTQAVPFVSGAGDGKPRSSSEQKTLENELRDPKYFLEYFLPRPLRLTFLGAGAASCLIATFISGARVSAGVQAASADGSLRTLGVNALGFALFAGLFAWDQGQARVRVARRAVVRQKQIEFGDRCVAVHL